jgi:hypothetical protein
MTKYENKQLSKSTFVMEDCFFINCVLTDCDLFYSGGDVEWMKLQFVNCRWHFRGPALRTVQTLMQLGMLKQGPTLPVPPAGSSMNVN